MAAGGSSSSASWAGAAAGRCVGGRAELSHSAGAERGFVGLLFVCIFNSHISSAVSSRVRMQSCLQSCLRRHFCSDSPISSEWESCVARRLSSVCSSLPTDPPLNASLAPSAPLRVWTLAFYLRSCTSGSAGSALCGGAPSRAHWFPFWTGAHRRADTAVPCSSTRVIADPMGGSELGALASLLHHLSCTIPLALGCWPRGRGGSSSCRACDPTVAVLAVCVGGKTQSTHSVVGRWALLSFLSLLFFAICGDQEGSPFALSISAKVLLGLCGSEGLTVG